jgi:hypothetical protein
VRISKTTHFGQRSNAWPLVRPPISISRPTFDTPIVLPIFMAKRKRDNQELIASASDSPPLILTHDSAEALIRRLLTQFKIDPTLLEDESAGLYV